MNGSQFPPISDRAHFPLLTAGNEQPCADLIGCDKLVFYAATDLARAQKVIKQEGRQWHLYGDARWPDPTVYIEFNGHFGPTGVLVMRADIPAEVTNPFDWIAANLPLMQLYPAERSQGVIAQRQAMLNKQANSTEECPGPEDRTPRYVQSYCLYTKLGDVRLMACYSDLLNAAGIPIPNYRMAGVERQNITFCQFSLHALFSLNEARRAGMPFTATPQLAACEPVRLEPGQDGPNWARFHPSRTLRTRPAVRALPNPSNMMNGIMQIGDFKRMAEARRQEINLQNLAFNLDARLHRMPHDDVNVTMSAFSHRANGGAIYVLPGRLVEEFDNTDCDEVRMSDLRLPFATVFLKFTPPQPLFLADGAPVDGCYIAKQGDEYLLTLTSHLEGADYTRSLSVACLDPTFSLHLPAPALKLDQPREETDLTVNEAVERGIQAFLDENAPPKDNFSRTFTRPDGTTSHIEDVRARSRQRRIAMFRSQEPVFRACLNIIINAACFISFRPEDITEDWDGTPPAWVVEALNDPSETRSARDRKRDALRNMADGDYTRIKICGKNLFSDEPHEGLPGSGVSPRAHWRRGHWRRQRHGVGLSLVTPRWIRPTIVKPENGPLVETRIYDVDKPPEKGNGP